MRFGILFFLTWSTCWSVGLGTANGEVMYRWQLVLSDVRVAKTNADGKTWDPWFWGPAPDLYFQVRTAGRTWASPLRRNRYIAFRKAWKIGGIEPKKLTEIEIEIWDKDRGSFHDLVAQKKITERDCNGNVIRTRLASWRCLLKIVKLTDETEKPKKTTQINTRGEEQNDQAERERGEKKWGKHSVYALMIGIDRYSQTSDWGTLSYAEADIAGIARVLATKGHIPNQNMIRLLGKEASREAVLMRIEDIKNRAKSGDTVLLVFAGHGERLNGSSYLVLYDTIAANLRSTALLVQNLTLGWKTSRVVVMLDACHSGVGIDSVRSGEGRESLGVEEGAFSGSGRVLLSSSRQSQKSYEDSELGHGLFSYAMMEALSGAADSNVDGVVTLTEAYTYTYHRVRRMAKKRKNRIQEPIFSGAMAGEIALSFPTKRNKQDIQAKRTPRIKVETDALQKQQENKRIHAGARKAEFVRGQEWTMRFIPAGSFWMGSLQEADEQPVRCVSISRNYWMMEREVTQKQYAALTGKEPWYFRDCKKKDCPVERVSWHQAAKFANILSKEQKLSPCFVCNQSAQCHGVSDYTRCKGWRLPTEAEWEYAARAQGSIGVCKRAIQQKIFPAQEIAWYGSNSGQSKDSSEAVDCAKRSSRQDEKIRCGTHPVGLKKPNLWGLHDMLGNVSEWVYDVYTGYEKTNQKDPVIRKLSRAQKERSQRVYRGGAWRSSEKELTSTFRQHASAIWQSSHVGFRLIRSE